MMYVSVTDQAWGQDGWILASSFYACLRTEPGDRDGQVTQVTQSFLLVGKECVTSPNNVCAGGSANVCASVIQHK